MRSWKGINVGPLSDQPHVRRELESVSAQLYEVTAAIRSIGEGKQPNQTGSTLALAYTPPAPRVVTPLGRVGQAPVVLYTYEGVGLTGPLADTIMLDNPVSGLYRLTTYLIVTTGGTGNITLKAYWNDGTSPGADYTLGTGAATAGQTFQVCTSFAVDSAMAESCYFLTNSDAAPGGPVYNLYVAIEAF